MASSPIVWRLLGRVMDPRASQPEKAELPMDWRLSERVMDLRALQSKKA